MSDSTRIGDTDYEILAEQEDGGGDYEWTQVALVRDPAGHLFLYRDGGCSCYGPWDSPNPADLHPVTSWQDAVNQVRDDMPWSFTEAEVVRFGEKLMALQPAPSVQP